MLNNLSRRNFWDMSQLVRLEGKHTWQNAHCALQWIDQILIKAATQQSLNGRNFRMLGKNEGQIHFQSYSSIQDPHWALSYSPFPFRASTTTSCVTGQIVRIRPIKVLCSNCADALQLLWTTFANGVSFPTSSIGLRRHICMIWMLNTFM